LQKKNHGYICLPFSSTSSSSPYATSFAINKLLLAPRVAWQKKFRFISTKDQNINL
jgi:hypothetical protein